MTKKMIVVIALLGLTGCVASLEDLTGEVRYADLSKSEDLNGAEQLEARVELKFGNLEIGPGDSAKLYELDLRYNELAVTPEVELARDGGVAKLTVGLSGEGKSIRSMGDTRLTLRLNDSLPLDLEARTGVGESEIDLSGFKLDALELECGVGEAKISMLSPNSADCGRFDVTSGVGSLEVVGLGNIAFSDFRFRGGVGEAKLDFSGDWRRLGSVEIDVGVGGVELRFPRELGVEARVSKNFLSGFDMEGFTQKGDTYYSENIDRTDKLIKLRIRAGIGGVTVKWI